MKPKKALNTNMMSLLTKMDDAKMIMTVMASEPVLFRKFVRGLLSQKIRNEISSIKLKKNIYAGD